MFPIRRQKLKNVDFHQVGGFEKEFPEIPGKGGSVAEWLGRRT